MHVRDVLSGKSSLVHTCSPDDTLADVVDLLVGHNIGSLIVMQGPYWGERSGSPGSEP